MKYSPIQRINECRNFNLIGLLQYRNFGRKYEAAAVNVNISRLPSKNCLVRQAQMRERERERDRDKAFLRRRGINIELFALRREHGDFERKSLTLAEKLEKDDSLPVRQTCRVRRRCSKLQPEVTWQGRYMESLTFLKIPGLSRILTAAADIRAMQTPVPSFEGTGASYTKLFM
ncbi:hypothetical protein TNCV_300811 [Trichonephila clavipes]|nr:hypothetical protein TNCV_300811 [Trichonephila clavipes]